MLPTTKASPATPNVLLPAQRRGPDRAAPSRAVPPTAPAGSRAPWRSLRHRSMRWWSLANLASNAGAWMQLTVQNLLVLQLTGSAAVTGLSLALQVAPGLLLGLVGGAAVDRWPRKLTATVSQAVLAGIAFATAALVALGALSVPALMVLAVLTGLVATIEGPACALLGNDLVPPEDVPSAISVGSVVHSVGRLAGTASAGVVVGLFGMASAYVVNGISFVLVAAVIPFLRPAAGAVEADAHQPPPEGRGVRDGVAFFCSRRRLVALACLTGMGSMLGRNYGLTLAALVSGALHGGAQEYGVIATVLAGGGITGAVLAGRLRSPSVRLVAALTAAGGVLQCLAALSPTLLFLALLVVPMAVLESLSDTAVSTILQTDPPAHLRGRVLGAWRSVSTVWGLAGPLVLGVSIQALGARGALLSGGLLVGGAVGGAAAVRRRPAGPAAAVEQVAVVV
ncbi:MFS transporter [Kitasatospora sp. A2-31]|uniref:MFS transporter n=1 Tax=Kitasatospora sp. A2-31 TaxID=2916414 RepID=UPI001EEA0691|nr:MFS transporter [Kitasatospora sp. A2-31]MCG6497759.1 MFS transporter [Kitasatospora sp. A2-31]